MPERECLHVRCCWSCLYSLKKLKYLCDENGRFLPYLWTSSIRAFVLLTNTRSNLNRSLNPKWINRFRILFWVKKKYKNTTQPIHLLLDGRNGIATDNELKLTRETLHAIRDRRDRLVYFHEKNRERFQYIHKIWIAASVGREYKMKRAHSANSAHASFINMHATEQNAKHVYVSLEKKT